jgi:hypothetical protein
MKEDGYSEAFIEQLIKIGKEMVDGLKEELINE